MTGIAAFPALINIHDHFNGNYLPKVGPPPGEFYLNWSGLGQATCRNSDVIKVERAKTSVEDRYFLSAYKNLFSGVVTANDHFPHEWNEPFIPRLPMRVIRNYTLAHACSSFDLKWGDGFEIEHARARQERTSPSSPTSRRASTRRPRGGSRSSRSWAAWTITPS